MNNGINNTPKFNKSSLILLSLGLLIIFILIDWFWAWNWNYKDFHLINIGMVQPKVKNTLGIIWYSKVSGTELEKWKSYRNLNLGGGQNIKPELTDKITEMWIIPRASVFYGDYLMLCFDSTHNLVYQGID